MVIFIRTVALLVLLPHLSRASQSCPLLGPDFPAPRNLSGNAAVQDALANLTEVLDAKGAPHSPLEEIWLPAYTSFSVELFSAHDPKSLFQYHHSAGSLVNSTSGVKKVDSNSIYRIGSISKLFTVYTFLIESGDVKFNEPVTKYVPELKAAAKKYNARQDPVNYVDWEAITIGALASQTADIGRDYSTLGEIAHSFPNPSIYGLPLLNASEIPTCGSLPFPLCDRKAFFDGFAKKHPVYAPSTSPIYSNVAYQILAYALEGITGQPFERMLDCDIINKLNLTHTSLKTPRNSSFGVIPNSITPSSLSSETTSGWNQQLGDEGPAGSIYSSTHDMAAFGRSILLSSLLPGTLTRRWMKPSTFTSDLKSAVGAPWEILRLPTSYPPYIIDAYTKNGGIGVYSSILVLIPSLEIGFIILSAGPGGGLTIESVSYLIVRTILPAIEVAARDEATAAYAGNYASPDASLNSSVTFATDPSHPGLRVSSWISNGTNMLRVLGLIATGSGDIPITTTLYPTNLRTETDLGTKEAWRSVLEASSTPTDPEVSSSSCYSWAGVDSLQYGSVALDDWLFTLGKDGKATSVEPRILRVSLQKT